ncbi:DUF2993 domain-containing protein [Actinoplanes sp. NPDC051851]|uniref:LmeA family phospholipid-binding protein n=1 Tax=Actinoplanes sp. NPDC051851 TaxID=3154753 RepID=UPI003442A8F8
MRKRSLVITGAVTAFLMTAGVGADRVAAAGAGARAADRLRCAAGLTVRPSVSFGGLPFVTQLARGRFDTVRVSAEDVPVGTLRASVRATAHDVTLPSGPSSAASFSAGSLSVTAIIAYADLPGGLPLAYDDAGRLRLDTTVRLLGRDVPVVVHATPSISGGSLVVRPDEVEVTALGVRLPATDLGARAAPRTVALPTLPAGLRYGSAEAAADGLHLTVEGSHLTLGRTTTPPVATPAVTTPAVTTTSDATAGNTTTSRATPGDTTTAVVTPGDGDDCEGTTA